MMMKEDRPITDRLINAFNCTYALLLLLLISQLRRTLMAAHPQPQPAMLQLGTIITSVVSEFQSLTFRAVVVSFLSSSLSLSMWTKQLTLLCFRDVLQHLTTSTPRLLHCWKDYTRWRVLLFFSANLFIYIRRQTPESVQRKKKRCIFKCYCYTCPSVPTTENNCTDELTWRVGRA